MVSPVRLAYYCSGHGYGHATRVSAFASSLLSLEVKPEICVVSSAPSNVFSECISRGARYRHADVDPVIVQPLAYKVDRQKSLEALQAFLSEKEDKMAVEIAWLLSERMDCVLSDAAFLACEAATKACIPSILITNFTFDSVYSYLGAEITDRASGLPNDSLQIPHTATLVHDIDDDVPISADVLAPLVSQLLEGYRHADILLLLPGFIPIPSFFKHITLPAPAWIDPSTNKFRPEIESVLMEFPRGAEPALHPPIPFPACTPKTYSEEATRIRGSNRKPPRTVKRAPLLVRPASPHIHIPERRSELLSSIGIPENLHDPAVTQILVVSFGGQIIRRPHGGRSPSRTPSPLPEDATSKSIDAAYSSSRHHIRGASLPEDPFDERVRSPGQGGTRRPSSMLTRRASAKIFIPGAPAPANNPASPLVPSGSLALLPGLQVFEADRIQPSPLNALPLSSLPSSLNSTQAEDEPSLLPSSSWIAIICGVPSNWSVSGDEEDLPPGFYIAPRDVYMPDLTAVADVLMGKLGYGTVSETVAQSTPFVYVPRPLFVEEHGLRLFLEAEGTGVELSRSEYESGEWARKVAEAYLKGKKRQRAKDGNANEQKVKDLAGWVVETIKQCKKDSAA